jgi:Prokaryotic dksA/traR C4-type zinc finger
MNCADCGLEIPAKRLAALKGAPILRCIRCQEYAEASGKVRFRPPHTLMLAVPSEADDMTRVREEGWA